jgi:hypothetical protein
MINKKRRRNKKNQKNLLEKFHEEISKEIDTSQVTNFGLLKQPKVKNVKVFDEDEVETVYEK